jgi:hypothetical protein
MMVHFYTASFDCRSVIRLKLNISYDFEAGRAPGSQHLVRVVEVDTGVAVLQTLA